jgi:hypothetical protein
LKKRDASLFSGRPFAGAKGDDEFACFPRFWPIVSGGSFVASDFLPREFSGAWAAGDFWLLKWRRGKMACAEREARWVDAWNGLYDIVGDRTDVACQLLRLRRIMHASSV